jgi:hypothetical protein
MTFGDIEQAIGEHLATMPGVPPIAWPNRDFPPGDTFVEFRHVPGERVDDVIAGGYPYQTGIVLVTVVTEAGKFNTEANEVSQAIADRFPKALRLASGGGNVVLNAPSSPGTPFQDKAYWRQPIRVSYITEG